jgi:phage gp29-like protein
MSTPGNNIFNRLAGAVRRALVTAGLASRVDWANSWRDNYNPLRGLTMVRAVSMLEEGERGAYAELQWTYRSIEMQDAVIGALIERRTSALQEMDWDIRVRDDVPEDKKAVADRQVKALRAAYESIDNLKEAIEFLALASFRGFSHLEKVRDGANRVVKLDPVEQWFWVREGIYGEWKLNPESKIGWNLGEATDLSSFVIREVKRPINRVALVHYIRKGLSQKDWDGFVEQFGIPAVFVTMPSNVPADKVDEYLEMADSVTGDARGVLPGGCEVTTMDGGARGANPFRDHLKYQDEQLVLRGTGGKLTMLAESGSGTLAGEAHADTFQAIAKAEAAEIGELLQAELDAEILDAVTPGESAWAYFELAANEETDTSQIVEDVEALKRAGYLVSAAWISEKTGYDLTVQAGGGADGGLQGVATGVSGVGSEKTGQESGNEQRALSGDSVASLRNREDEVFEESELPALTKDQETAIDSAVAGIAAGLEEVASGAVRSGMVSGARAKDDGSDGN